MQKTTFGSTGLIVGRTGFGGIPIQRIPYADSTRILHRAYDAGITLYDTANAYTTSEDRIGQALSHVRPRIVIATKSGKQKPNELLADLHNSLKMLRTDYIDIFQFHCPNFVPMPGDEHGIYDALLKEKEAGRVRHIGISAHKLHLAREALESGLYESLQYPFSYVSSPAEMELVPLAARLNVGLLGMKSLAGGLIRNAKAAFWFLRNHEPIVPIWGIQKIDELDEILSYENSPPELTDELREDMESDIAKLSGNFCRGCGYCLPCPAKIPIPMAARITFLLGRSLFENFSNPEWQAHMKKVDECTNCGHCRANCPYELDVPRLLGEQAREYFLALESAGVRPES